MLKVCCQNQLKWRYALADSWFSSSENMKYIHATLEKQFIFALKSNRLIALNKEDRQRVVIHVLILFNGQKILCKAGLKGGSFRSFFTVKSLQTKMTVQGLFI